jgi:hypothetical protein
MKLLNDCFNGGKYLHIKNVLEKRILWALVDFPEGITM